MRVKVPMLDLTRDRASVAAEIQAAWGRVLQHMQLLRGEEVRRFEQEIAAYIGVAHAVGVGSGTDALLLTLAGLGIGRGDRVILPANAFVAALEAIHHVGAQPVLVDTQADGFAPDWEAVTKLAPAKAMIVVHLYGAALDVAPALALGRRNGMRLIEDASHAHGARRDGRHVGSFEAAGCFSAGVVKNLAAFGDAGFVTTDDAELAHRVRILGWHGQETKGDHETYGFNSRLDELQAATLRVKLRHLETRNERRRAIAAYYSEQLGELPLHVPTEAPGEHAVYHQYVVRCSERDRLRIHLREQGIESAIHYPSPLHRQSAWRRHYGAAPALPNAERLAREILSLPVFPELTDDEVEDVVRGVRSFFGSRTRPATSRTREQDESRAV
jgi:dTDP-4-amino-4,6-dideoxygalactose transaminase